ncbi:LysR substrate-binding domain-containing protein [Xenophilus arseniciresistens]|uniref:LysR substrate-binding domain-containing protein n=1 Tax=Xenophilus arseniciresistens TaxID=1283306 RepID=A0AAE3NDW2_9BURK|nr:LysR substrate-binding domain-containing protein [Xenophilus arseniciresistens]MDA7419051.1 LysR substrate-binding domain-containing protein [Xenophilus arseniciresistens]
MDLRTLRYFIAVVEAGSLSRAAGSLYVAQPALTAQIKKLEADLDARLLQRSHVGVTPTPAGLQLYEDARRLLSDAAAVRERIQRLPKGPEGSVTVALPFLLAALLMGPVLTTLKEQHPRIRVFVLDDLSLMVRKAMTDGRADIGLLVDTPHAEGLVCRPLATESIYFCGLDRSRQVRGLLRKARRAPPAKTREYFEIDFADAAAQPLVLQSRRFAIRRSVEDAALAHGLTLNVAHEHDSAGVIRSLSNCGAGFTFTPACAMVARPPEDPDWIAARVVRPGLDRSYTLATADRSLDEATAVVARVLVEQAHALVASGQWAAREAPPRAAAKGRR